mgnify:CR=1 FL=1
MDKIAYQEIRLQEEMHGEHHSKFDWWQATVSLEGWSTYDSSTGETIHPAENLVKWLSSEITMVDAVRGRGSNSYELKTDFKRGDRIICTVQWGGVNPDPNITATGSDSAFIRGLITAKFPEGRISRVDSAFDSMSGTAEFQRVCAWAEERAEQAGVNCTWIKNSDTTKGDTLYIGSKTSRIQIRIYEKGKQTGYKPGEWWRAEVQFRPESRNKSSAYKYSSGMVWGASRITRDLWSFLGGEKLAAIEEQYSMKQKDLEDRLAHLVKQYGNLLREAVESTGSWVAVGSKLDRLSEQMGKGRILPPEAGERG